MSCVLLLEGVNAGTAALHASGVKIGDVLVNGFGNLLAQQARACVEQNSDAHQFFDKRL